MAERKNRSGSEERQRNVLLATRVNAGEERRIREAARARRISVARLLRESALAAADRVTGEAGSANG